MFYFIKKFIYVLYFIKIVFIWIFRFFFNLIKVGGIEGVEDRVLFKLGLFRAF